MKAEASVGPPTSMSPSNSVRSRASSSAGSPAASRLFHWTTLSVDENTTFGRAFQMRAKSSMTSVAAGSDAAVGQ